AGTESRSPYSPEVDAAYRQPPAAVPAEFAALVGREIVIESLPTRLGMQRRLGDASGTLLGRLLHKVVIGAVGARHREALKMPDSLERDAAIKEGNFLVRMMATVSMRSMVMTAAGALPYRAAELIAALADGHPIRGVRQFARRGRDQRRAAVRR